MSDGNDLLRSVLFSGQSQSTPSSNSLMDLLSQPMPPISKPLFQPQILPSRVPLLRTVPTTEAGLIKRIKDDTARIVRRQFRTTRARKIPLVADVAFDEAKLVQTSVLHIDIRGSSSMINLTGHVNALKIYKIFHSTMVSIARFKGGRVRTFAGDRIGVFFDIDKLQRTRAVETALLMQAVVEQVIKPVVLEQFIYLLDCGIGVDYGEMLVGRIGQYGDTNNDLVWTGNAANFASKLADYDDSGVFISEEIHKNMDKSLKEDMGMIWQPITDPKLGNFHKFIGIRTL